MTDASRLRIAGGAAVLAGAVAAGALLVSRGGVAPPRPVSAPAPADRPQGATPPAAQPPAEAARPTEPPRFDVVRMGARGNVVVAGRAAPGAEVGLMEGGREIGRARADPRGEWVILPADPLGSGARELSLRARQPGGEEMAGPDTVMVVGPSREEPPATRSGEPSPAGEGEKPLVLLLPPTAEAAPRTLSARTDPAPAPLGLDVVDYDEGSAMRFAGTAPPGSRLRVYSDDRHVGDATAGPDGRWSLSPDPAPPLGRHLLRVDQLGTGGSAPVAGRVEVAFQREALPPGALRDGRVVVQPGHNLWRIARDSYGRGTRYTVIFRANQAQIRNPARIYPGQRLAIP